MSKKAEMYTKVKRLKQMIEGGKSYNDYLDERRKYGQENNPQIQSTDDASHGNEESAGNEDVTDEFKETFRKAVAAGLISKTSDPNEVMRKVLQYKAANPTTATVASSSSQLRQTTTNDVFQQQILPARIRSQRIAFLPDCGVQDTRRFFYRDLSKLFDDYKTSQSNSSDEGGKDGVTFDILPMPYVYEMNTKRYETKWMEYMRGLKLSAYDVVVGHLSSAEALLRYLESETVDVCLLIDGSDIYTAGERHGRAYRYSLIRDHCSSVRIVSVNAKGAAEAITLQSELQCRTQDRSAVAVDEQGGGCAAAKVIFDIIVEDLLQN